MISDLEFIEEYMITSNKLYHNQAQSIERDL